MLKKYNKVLMMAILYVGWSINAEAGSIYATSCSQYDVQAAINLASNGDTVYVPAGNCTWTTQTSGPSVQIVNKEIVLAGAGVDLTVITDGTGSRGGEDPLVISGNNWRVTGFTFNGMQRRAQTEPAVNAAGTGWRVDHCKFDATSTVPSNGRGMYATGIGLIDHNTFRNTYQGIAVFGSGDRSWTEPLTLGSDNAVYIEDNDFNYDYPFDGATDAYSGARLVFRYNNLTNTVLGVHGFDTGGYRATFSYEIYNNTFNKVTSGKVVAINLRGGTGVVFNNSLMGNYWGMNLVNYRTCTDYAGGIGKCTGDDANDGNTTPKEVNFGWPCRDQIGRTTNQMSYPLHEWNNSLNGADCNFGINDFCSSGIMSTAHIVEGRDYFSNISDTLYVAYSYPHPLARISPLTPPKNLKISPST